MLELNPGVIIWTAITFACLLILLRAMAWKPILAALDNREESIRQSIDRAEEAKRDAERILEANQKNLADAEQKAQQLIKEARDLAEKLRRESVTRAAAEAEKLLKQAREEIERDKEQAVSQLHSLVAELAVKAAEKILSEAIDEKKQKTLVDGFLKSLPRN